MNHCLHYICTRPCDVLFLVTTGIFALLPDALVGQTGTYCVHCGSSDASESRSWYPSAKQSYPGPLWAAPAPSEHSPPLPKADRAFEASLLPWRYHRRVDIPGIRRYEVDAFRGCGPIVVAMLLTHYHDPLRKEDYERLLLDLDPDRDGSSAEEVTAYLAKHGFRALLSERTTPETLQRSIDRGLPVILIVNTDRGTHWCLVAGYEIDTHGRIVSWELRDNGVMGGVYSREEFFRMWHFSREHLAHLFTYEGEALILEPLEARTFPKNVTLSDLSPSTCELACEVPFRSPKNYAFPFAAVYQAASSGHEIGQAEFDSIANFLDPDRNGVTPEEAARYLEVDFETSIHYDQNPADLKAQIDIGLPIFVLLSSGGEPTWALVSGYSTEGGVSPASWSLVTNDELPHELPTKLLLSLWKRLGSCSLTITPKGDLGKNTKRRMTLTDHLRRLIVESGTSHYRIALDTGITQPVITRFVNGDREISLTTADKLTEYFDLELRRRSER